MECLKHMLQGKTAKQAAQDMGGISHRTVETHWERTKEKLDCHTKMELVKRVWG